MDKASIENQKKFIQPEVTQSVVLNESKKFELKQDNTNSYTSNGYSAEQFESVNQVKQWSQGDVTLKASIDKKLYDIAQMPEQNSFVGTEQTATLPESISQVSDRYHIKREQKPKSFIQDIKKGNRNNQIVSSSKVSKTDMMQPIINTEDYILNVTKQNTLPSLETLTRKSDETVSAIPQIIQKEMKLIKLGPLRFKKNRITKSLNKLQMQANLRNSDTQSLLAISVYNPSNLKQAIEKKVNNKNQNVVLLEKKLKNQRKSVQQGMNETHNMNLKLIHTVQSNKANDTQAPFVKDTMQTMDASSDIEYKAPMIVDNGINKNSFSTTNLGSVSLINIENLNLQGTSQMTNTRSGSVLKAMSLAQLVQNKKQIDDQAVKLHTRIQYLQNQEQKKLRKIAETRQVATNMFQNKLENRMKALEIRKANIQCNQEKVTNAQEKKMEQKSTLAKKLFEERQMEAKQIRKQSKKLEKAKFKKEVEHVRKNMVRRDDIWLYQKAKAETHRGAASVDRRSEKAIAMNGLVMEENKKIQLNLIKRKERKISKLQSLEKQFMNRIQSTSNLEQTINTDIEQEKEMQKEILQTFNLNEILQLADSKSTSSLDNRIVKVANQTLDRFKKKQKGAFAPSRSTHSVINTYFQGKNLSTSNRKLKNIDEQIAATSRKQSPSLENNMRKLDQLSYNKQQFMKTGMKPQLIIQHDTPKGKENLEKQSHGAQNKTDSK